MKTFFHFSHLAVLTVVGAVLALPVHAEETMGAGSTFVYPVMSKWSSSFNRATGKQVNYLSVGSGGGIAQIRAGTVTFGATDMPLKPQELQAAGLAQFPIVIGGVVPVVNLPGVKPGDMKFTGAVLADIYLGKVAKWNDAKITTLNPGIKLPDQRITVVHRADSSGTTFNWVNYLAKVSDEWKTKVGEGISVTWPVGVAGKGNEGVAANVNSTAGAIGYVELAYATQKKMSFTALQNKDGQFVQPNAESFQAAAVNADWTRQPDFYEVITNASGKESWPIAATTFVLMYKESRPSRSGKDALEFFKWALESGQNDAKSLDYISLPSPLVKQIEGYWAKNIK